MICNTGYDLYHEPTHSHTHTLSKINDVLLVELMTGRYPIESKRPVKERVTIYTMGE